MTEKGMDEYTSSGCLGDHVRLRRCILYRLYEIFKDFPYASVELSQISEECHADPGELNWNIVYLEKCGYVELAKSYECPPFIAPSVTITASGIDIVEDEREFNSRFPDRHTEKTDDKP
ncbi:hypothetical protein ACFL0O_04285 [Thermodesulfobacteriota bacterium]